ncbi:MAG: translocation and assembly module TamB [Sphingomonadales bacterium]|jgi:translocation and assembly module TamB|nr:translocation and assembly module TamB [Sphingomonadales bacterium]
MAEEIVIVRRRPSARTVAKYAGFTLLGIVLLIGAFLAWLNTDSGRRFILGQINAFETVSGLKVHVGRIEGSVFSEVRFVDLSLADPQGTFFRADRADIQYRPFAYLFTSRIDIKDLDIPVARLSRLPALRAGDPNAPLLPDIDADIGHLRIGRLLIDPAVTGRRHLLSLDSRIRIADGRAQIGLNARTLAAPGLAGGDRLILNLDAVPAANRLGLALSARGPGTGFIAGLIGTDQAVAARIFGQGDWASWQGRAQATLGGRGIADLAITGRDGTFGVQGPLRPALILTGPAQRLAAPLVQMNLISTLENRRADIRLRMNSRALALAAEGLVDLGQNRFQNLRLAARLTEPGAIAPDLRGRDVRLAMVLNGQFATPGVAYELTAASLTFGTTTVERLRAVGSARVRADGIIVPVSATASRILGFDLVAGGRLDNVTLNGEIGVDGLKLVSDDLILRSDRVNARLAIAFDIAAGRYLAGLQGRVSNYLVAGVGLFSVDTHLDMTSGPSGFGLSGRVAARSRRIDNDTIRDLLRGDATITARIAMEPSGLVRVSNVLVASPGLRVISGGGVYRRDGSLDLRFNGVSDAYGPLVVHVTGSARAPRVALEAANPGFGIGLRNVTANVRAVAGGWAIEATGESAYGPFTADVVVLSGRGPMIIDVRRLTFAGIDFRGRIVRTAAGPYAGTLTMTGQGISGTVRLAAAGRYQRIDIAATANGARTPGDTPIIIQRAIVQATIILSPQISIQGDAQLAGLSSGSLFVQRARVRANLLGGTGTAQLFAEGRRAVPFRIAANAAVSPELVRAAAQGQVNNIGFRFAQPAEVRREGANWRLAPVTINLDRGRVRLAGVWGNGIVVQSRLDSFDLSMLNAFSPGLGLGGQASGSLDFAQPSDASFPRAEARLNVAGFTRTGIATRSVPVDLFMAGNLRPEGGQAAAILRRGGAIIGRVQARLQPLGPGAGSWTTRLLAAPLEGGIRYNGPADVPMSFANFPGHHLSGPIGIAADFSGRVQAPQFTGIVRANNLVYQNETYGTRITNLAVDGRFSAAQLEIVRLAGRAGRGTVEGHGTIGLAASAGFPINLELQFQNAQLARSDDLSGTATGNLAIVNDRSGASISGTLELGEARYQIVRQAAAEVPQLAGVRRRGQPLRTPGEDSAEKGVPSIWRLDIRLNADNRVYVSGMGMESEWQADLRLQGTTATPAIAGRVELIRGTLGLAGRRFRLDSGLVVFTGERPANPQIDLVATSTIEQVEVGINVTGRSNNPQIAFTSSPGLPQDEIVARILFGSSVTQISALQAVQLAASLNSLRGSGGGLNPLGRLRSATGIDRLRLVDADTATGRGTAVAAGMYLSDDIYVEIITDAKGFTATQLEISLSRTLSLLSQFGSNSGTNVNIRYNRDY